MSDTPDEFEDTLEDIFNPELMARAIIRKKGQGSLIWILEEERQARETGNFRLVDFWEEVQARLVPDSLKAWH